MTTIPATPKAARLRIDGEGKFQLSSQNPDGHVPIQYIVVHQDVTFAKAGMAQITVTTVVELTDRRHEKAD